MFWLNLLPPEGRKSIKGIVCIEKNRGEPSASVQQSDDSKAVFWRKILSEENINEKTKRQCSTKQDIANNNSNEDAQSSDDSVSNASSDD